MIGGSLRKAIHFRRELAHFDADVSNGLAWAINGGRLSVVDTRPSRRLAANCQNRYPSPDRSGLLRAGPVSVSGPRFRPAHGEKPTAIGYHPNMGVDVGVQNGDSVTTFNPQRGRKLCLRNHGSSQLLRHSRLPVALSRTWSVGLLVRLLVLLRLMQLVLIRQLAHLLVALRACCVTMRVSAAAHAKTNRAPLWCATITDAVGDHPRRRFCV